MKNLFSLSLIAVFQICLLNAMQEPPMQIDNGVRVWLPVEDSNDKPRSEQLEEGLRNGSITLGSLRDSGEHIMACNILNRIARDEQENDLQSPRGKKAIDIIYELNNYLKFRNADITAQKSLEQVETLLKELKELATKSS